jgi:DNA-binding LacI/PurR family transcriptional regulator
MTISLKHISKATGYSISTVSRVLTNKISGNSVSAKEILRVAREMGYSKFRSTVSPKNRVLDIALITQHYSEEFYAYLYSAFDKISLKRNCSLTIHSVRHVKSLLDELLFLSKNHDGFILFLPTLDPFSYNKIKESMSNYPIVSIAPSFEAVFDTFTFDSYQGGALAAQAFIEKGYKKFGIIRGPIKKWEAALRRNGFKDTVENEGYKVIWDYKGNYSFESGEKAFHNIYKKRRKNIAIFASNDQMAVGFIHAALEHNQQVPKDYAMIGYDNILFSKIFFPKLTTIDTDIDQLSEEAIDHLIRRIKNEVNLDRSARKILIPVKLIKRDTHK